MNWLLEEMEECGADGVDFVFLFRSEPVYATYSKEEILDMLNLNFFCVPKSNRRYWKWTKDKKIFIPDEEAPGVYEITDLKTIRVGEEPYLVHVDISGVERGRVHAALYSQSGDFGALHTDTPQQMVEQLCARWRPGIVYVIDPRGYSVWYIDELMKREVKVVPPRSTDITTWLPRTDRG